MLAGFCLFVCLFVYYCLFVVTYADTYRHVHVNGDGNLDTDLAELGEV
jgi:hypothetical protein